MLSDTRLLLLVGETAEGVVLVVGGRYLPVPLGTWIWLADVVGASVAFEEVDVGADDEVGRDALVVDSVAFSAVLFFVVVSLELETAMGTAVSAPSKISVRTSCGTLVVVVRSVFRTLTETALDEPLGRIRVSPTTGDGPPSSETYNNPVNVHTKI